MAHLIDNPEPHLTASVEGILATVDVQTNKGRSEWPSSMPICFSVLSDTARIELLHAMSHNLKCIEPHLWPYAQACQPYVQPVPEGGK